MTGIADAILYLKKPYSRDRRKRFVAHFLKPSPQTRFAVLSWKRTGSNMLCGILFNHPEIVMHNELFNPSKCLFQLFQMYQNLSNKTIPCALGVQQLIFSRIILMLSTQKMLLGPSNHLHQDGLFSPAIYFPTIFWNSSGLQRFPCRMNSSGQRTKQ